MAYGEPPFNAHAFDNRTLPDPVIETTFQDVSPPDQYGPGYNSSDLNAGGVPRRIPRVFHGFIRATASLGGVGSSHPWFDQLLLAPPFWTNATRGSRAVSGVMGRMQANDLSNVPAVFVPSEVR